MKYMIAVFGTESNDGHATVAEVTNLQALKAQMAYHAQHQQVPSGQILAARVVGPGRFVRCAGWDYVEALNPIRGFKSMFAGAAALFRVPKIPAKA